MGLSLDSAHQQDRVGSSSGDRRQDRDVDGRIRVLSGLRSFNATHVP